MKINQHDEFNGKIIIVEPVGAIDSMTAPILDDYITKLLDNGKLYIVLNFSYVDYISSSGIGAILYLNKKITQLKGIFVISEINTEISNIFSILGFNKIILLIQDKCQAAIKIEESLNSSKSLYTKNLTNDFQINYKEQLNTSSLDKPQEQINDEEQLNTSSLEMPKEPINDKEQLPVIALDIAPEELTNEKNTNSLDINKEFTSVLNINPKELTIENSKYVTKNHGTFNSFIWECPDCKSMIQITSTGQNSCSNCRKNFTVNADQTVFF